jgi:hypothetical protein
VQGDTLSMIKHVKLHNLFKKRSQIHNNIRVNTYQRNSEYLLLFTQCKTNDRATENEWPFSEVGKGKNKSFVSFMLFSTN